MTLRRWVAAILVCVAACAALLTAAAADRPSMEDQYAEVLHDSALELAIVVDDEEIDLNAPGVHPVRLVLLNGPSHGILVGDLASPLYDGPRRAVFSLVYVPAAGFTGRDVVSMVAVDGPGHVSSPAAIDIVVLAGRPVGLLAGSWDAEWTVNVQSAAITAFTQRLTEAYRVGAFALKGVAEFQMKSTGGPPEIVFDALRFESEAAVGAVRAKTALAFDPEKGPGPDLFDYFLARTHADLFSVALDHLLFLTRPQTESYQTVTVGASVGSVSVSSATRFDLGADCGFAFSRSDITATWAACDATFRAAAAFTDDGFQSLTVSAIDVPVPGVSWIPGDVDLDVAFAFRPTGKTFAVDVDWDPGVVGCARVYSELSNNVGPGTMGAVAVYGVVVTCDVAPGVAVTTATSLDPAKNAAVTGQLDYFELLRLSGDLALCCGIPGTWSVATYFRSGGSQLFDWGMTLLKADLGISSHWSLRLDAALRSGELGDPKAEFTVGWTTRW